MLDTSLRITRQGGDVRHICQGIPKEGVDDSRGVLNGRYVLLTGRLRSPRPGVKVVSNRNPMDPYKHPSKTPFERVPLSFVHMPTAVWFIPSIL